VRAVDAACRVETRGIFTSVSALVHAGFTDSAADGRSSIPIAQTVPAFTTAVTHLQRPRRNAAIWTDYGQNVRSVDDRRASGVGRDRARS
jgi:hypothetical protein